MNKYNFHNQNSTFPLVSDGHFSVKCLLFPTFTCYTYFKMDFHSFRLFFLFLKSSLSSLDGLSLLCFMSKCCFLWSLVLYHLLNQSSTLINHFCIIMAQHIAPCLYRVMLATFLVLLGHAFICVLLDNSDFF